jgi:WD40 repeat protein
MAFLKNKLLITGSKNIIKIWDVERGSCLQTIEAHHGIIWSLIDLNDLFIASSGEGHIIKVIYITRGTIKTIEGHGDEVWSLVNIRNEIIGSGSKDRMIYIYLILILVNVLRHWKVMNKEYGF